MAQSNVDERPVLFLFKLKDCSHCRSLARIWKDTVEAIDAESVKTLGHKLREPIVMELASGRDFDANKIPKTILPYCRMAPTVLLIPGPLWNRAMANLGPNNKVELKDGVMALNRKWDKGEVKVDVKHDMGTAAGLLEWFKAAAANKDFKRVQASASPVSVGAAASPAGAPAAAAAAVTTSTVIPMTTPAGIMVNPSFKTEQTQQQPVYPARTAAAPLVQGGDNAAICNMAIRNLVPRRDEIRK